MSLEDIPIKTPTTGDISEFIQNEYKSLTGATYLSTGGPVWTMSWALAAIYVLLYRFGTWAFNQIFWSSADPSNKKERGSEYGMSQGTGQKAVLEVVGGGGTPAATLPSGTLVQSVDGGYLYRTTSEATVTGGGSVTVQIQSDLPGEEYSTAGGSNSVQLVAPLAGIPNILFATLLVTPGIDMEEDEDYFTRIYSRMIRQPQGGSPGDYFLWATEVGGIIDIVIYIDAAGEIDVYPIADGTNGSDKIPSGAELTAVAASIDTSGQFVYMDRRPIDADVTVQTIGLDHFEVRLQGFTSNGGTGTQQTAIEEGILEYMGSLRPSNPALGRVGDITEVNANIIFSIVNTVTLAAGFTVDNVITNYDNAGTPILVNPKRALGVAKIAHFDGLIIES